MPTALPPLAAAPRELALPEPSAGWRSALLALGHRRGVALITAVSVLASLLVTWAMNRLFGDPAALLLDLAVATAVPLIVAPLVSGVAMGLLHEVEQARQQLYHAAVRDGLTKLYNRRFFMARLQAEVQRSWREGGPLSALLIDVDHFKAINDGHGHAAGDEVLESTAALLIDVLRPYDLVARYGGEEFVALLPGTTLQQALQVAERLRQAIERLSVPAMGGRPLPQVTASIGVASLGAAGSDSAEALLSRADQAMYAAKRGGRNRCEVMGG